VAELLLPILTKACIFDQTTQFNHTLLVRRMRDLWQDLRYSLRALFKNPGVPAAHVFTIETLNAISTGSSTSLRISLANFPIHGVHVAASCVAHQQNGAVRSDRAPEAPAPYCGEFIKFEERLDSVIRYIDAIHCR